MNKAPRLSADQRDNLVAYLDGELADVETQQIDQVLARSEVARHEVEALARTWELLDLLPKPNATTGFADRTLTTLRLAEVRTSMVDQPWFAYVRNSVVIVVSLVLLTVCGYAGYQIALQAIPNPQAEMLSRLPLLRNLDVYLEIRDLNFVKELQRSSLFAMRASGESETTVTRRLDPTVTTEVSQVLLEQRYEEVHQMPEIERDRLQRNWETFQQLTVEQQQAIRELHIAIASEPEAIHALLETYAIWLQTLSPGERDDLRRATSSGERIALVRQFKSRQDETREIQVFDLSLNPRKGLSFNPPFPHLDSAELAVVMDAAKKELELHEQQRITQSASKAEAYLWTVEALVDNARKGRVTDEAQSRIIAAIPDEVVRKFIERQATQEDRRRELVRSLGIALTGFYFEEMKQFLPTEAQLQEYFVKLDGDTRLDLMQLSPQELTRDLVRRYMEQLDDPQLKRLNGLRDRLRDKLFSANIYFGPRPGFFRGGERGGERGGPGGPGRPDDGGRPPENGSRYPFGPGNRPPRPEDGPPRGPKGDMPPEPPPKPTTQF
ncbi:hypothetical protein GC163_00815 [bacterium]|nr:hypothetical protein [bacterium]